MLLIHFCAPPGPTLWGSQFGHSQVFYIRGTVCKTEEGLIGSIVHTNGLELLSGMTRDALANKGNLTLEGSPWSEPGV